MSQSRFSIHNRFFVVALDSVMIFCYVWLFDINFVLHDDSLLYFGFSVPNEQRVIQIFVLIL